jgi:hypothetical protein
MSFIHPFHATHGTLRDNLSKHGEQNRKPCDGIDRSANPVWLHRDLTVSEPMFLVGPSHRSVWALYREPCEPATSWLLAGCAWRVAQMSRTPGPSHDLVSSLCLLRSYILPSSDSLHRHCSSKPSSLSAMPSPSVCFCRCSLLTYWRKKEHLLQDKSAIP